MSILEAQLFDDVFDALERLEQNGFTYEIVFLEAREEILIRRFKESRRKHPLSNTGGISDGIRAEKEKLEPIRGKASMIIVPRLLTPGVLGS